MKNITKTLIIVMLFSASCQHSHDEHSDHAHDAHGEHIDETKERPTVDHTIWTTKTELFVEFPALIVGNESRFAAHFTILDGHQAVKEGTVTVSLISKNDVSVSEKVEQAASAGIFTPTLIPTEAGVYQLLFEITSPTLSDKILIENIEVFANQQAAIQALGGEEENGNEISFLKEQAWKIDFQTTSVKQEEIYNVINTSGIWKSAPSDFKTISATTSGIVSFKNNSLTIGSVVSQGQILMSISSGRLNSNNLNAEIVKAKTNLDQAKFEYDRNKELYDLQIVSKSEFEQIEQKYNLAQVNYNTLSAGYDSGSKQVIVPMNGFIKSLKITDGSYVEQGDEIMIIAKQQDQLLEAFLSPSYFSQTAAIQDVFYKVNNNKWSSMKENNGAIVSVSKELSATHPQLSIFANVKDVIMVPEGGFVEVQIVTGSPSKALVIPESALLEDYGSYSAIVQLSGESFERRPLSIGKRNGEMVEIVKGLAEGEVVVSRGAFQVKMASMSGQAPAHGHAH